jgi:hypothetical protein
MHHPPHLIWCLLYSGVIEHVERAGDQATLTIHMDAVQLRGRLTVQLEGVVELSHLRVSDQWDEPWVTDPNIIAARRPSVRSVCADDLPSAVRIEDPKGTLYIEGHVSSFTLNERQQLSHQDLHDLAVTSVAQWQASWSGEGAHDAVASAVRAPRWTPDTVAALLTAWQIERTSELADALALVDQATRPSPPICLSPRADQAALDAWCDTWAEAPGAALDDLAQCAAQTFDLWTSTEPAEDRARAMKSIWEVLTQCVAALRGAAPDPRIGRALERMVRSPSDHWFRVDQVAHVAGPLTTSDTAPSFADHLLKLLAHHADRGAAARLTEEARRVSIEADCNGAEMAACLRALSRELAERWPTDRRLCPDVEAALWVRACEERVR